MSFGHVGKDEAKWPSSGDLGRHNPVTFIIMVTIISMWLTLWDSHVNFSWYVRCSSACLLGAVKLTMLTLLISSMLVAIFRLMFFMNLADVLILNSTHSYGGSVVSPADRNSRNKSKTQVRPVTRQLLVQGTSTYPSSLVKDLVSLTLRQPCLLNAVKTKKKQAF